MWSRLPVPWHGTPLAALLSGAFAERMIVGQLDGGVHDAANMHTQGEVAVDRQVCLSVLSLSVRVSRSSSRFL